MPPSLRSIEQRELGGTGLRVSLLGYGTGAGGGLMVRGGASDQIRAVEKAIDAGITYFDTAPGYGNGRSEENLGRALTELHAWDQVVVGTKVRLTELDLLEDPVARVRKSVEASLHRLGRDRVDLVQLHNPVRVDRSGQTNDDVLLEDALGGIAEGMQSVREAGLTRSLGFTGLGDTTALHAIARDERFQSVQAYFNALNPSAGFAGATGRGQDFDGLIELAGTHDMGVIAFRVLAAGALIGQTARHPLAGTPDAPLDAGPTYEDNLDRARALAPLVAEYELESLLELAFRFSLSNPGVSTALIGFSDVAQLDDALRWVARGPLPAAATEAIVGLAR